MKRDLRSYARQTNVQLAFGAFVLLFIFGLGLIWLIYGLGAAITGRKRVATRAAATEVINPRREIMIVFYTSS